MLSLPTTVTLSERSESNGSNLRRAILPIGFSLLRDPSTSTVLTVLPSSLRMTSWLDCRSMSVNKLRVLKNLRLRLWKQNASATIINYSLRLYQFLKQNFPTTYPIESLIGIHTSLYPKPLR